MVQIVLCHVDRSGDISRNFRFQKQLEIELVPLPTLSLRYLAACPSMSLVPLAPFLDFARNDI
jgi:hypothetical protein